MMRIVKFIANYTGYVDKGISAKLQLGESSCNLFESANYVLLEDICSIEA